MPILFIPRLEDLCIRKLADLVALEVEMGLIGIVDALKYVPTGIATSLLPLMARTGHASEAVIGNLIRSDFEALDLSKGRAFRFGEAGGCGGMHVPTLGTIGLAPLLLPKIGSIHTLDFSFAHPSLVDDSTLRLLTSGASRSSTREYLTSNRVPLRQLSRLSLRGLACLTDATVACALAACAKTLILLDVSGCPRLLIEKLRTPDPYDRGIARVSIAALTDEAFLGLGPLRGHAARGPVDAAFKALEFEAFEDDSKDGDDSDNDAEKSTDSSEKEIEVRLATLLVAGLPGLTCDNFLGPLCTGASAATLRTLSIKGCVGIGDVPKENSRVTSVGSYEAETDEYGSGCRITQGLLPALTDLNTKGLSAVPPEGWMRLLPYHSSSPSQGAASSSSTWQSPKLRRLRLGECDVDDRTLKSLLPPLWQNLCDEAAPPSDPSHQKSVDGNGCRGGGSSASGPTSKCTGLEVLDLSWVEGISAVSVLALVGSAGSSLRSLKLRCVNLDKGLSNEDEYQLWRKAAPIDASSSQEGTSNSTHEESAAVDTTTLQRSGSYFLSALGHFCPNLVKLNLSRCGDTIANPVALKGLARGLSASSFGSSLVNLDLSWTDACDHGMSILLCSSVGRSLEFLALQGCKRLSASIAEYIVSFTSELRCCDLSWVNSIDSDVVASLVERCPRLQVVDYYGEAVFGKNSRLPFLGQY